MEGAGVPVRRRTDRARRCTKAAIRQANDWTRGIDVLEIRQQCAIVGCGFDEQSNDRMAGYLNVVGQWFRSVGQQPCIGFRPIAVPGGESTAGQVLAESRVHTSAGGVVDRMLVSSIRKVRCNTS